VTEKTPQLEDGFTRFANEWLEAFIPSVYPPAVKEFVLAIARETWGWQETWREIPMGRIADILQVSQTRVKQLRKIACDHQLVEWELGRGPNSSGLYRVQKDWTQWIEMRLSGKWDEKYKVINAGQTGKDGITGKDGVTGNRGVAETGKDGLPANWEGRAARLKEKERKERQRIHEQSAAANGTPLFDEADVPVTSGDGATFIKDEAPHTAAANACLSVWGLKHEDLSGTQKASYYPAINKVMGDQEDGAASVQSWADSAGAGSRELAAEAKPERVIPAVVRKEITADGWQAAWEARRNRNGVAPGQKRGRGTGIVTNPDGSVDQERNWTEEQKFGVALARSEKGPKPGTTGWDEERGIAYDSAHHPDNPHYAEWLAEQNAPPKPKRGEPGYVMPPMPPLPDLTVLI
jgi:hypothetical protein